MNAFAILFGLVRRRNNVHSRKIALVFATALCLNTILLVAAHAASGSVTYVYDDLGRLVEVVYDDGTVIEYTYDAAGNRETTVTTLGQ
jgi:YD repeat-containing protein